MKGVWFDNCCIFCLFSSHDTEIASLLVSATTNNHELETGIGMNDLDVYDMDDAVAALEALHCALTYDLKVLEARIRKEQLPFTDAAAPDEHQVTSHDEARTLLHSGLASITEVLGWIQWKTEEDPEGD